jgi:hypothetical protein
MKKSVDILRVTVWAILVSGPMGVFQLNAQTHIPEGNVCGVWSVQESPYLINGDIVIPDDSTLTVNPGVQVVFEGYYKFMVQGRLLAVGTAEDSITFTASDTTAGWNGLRFNYTPSDNDSSMIVYCRLQYGRTTSSVDSIGGAIKVRGLGKLLISHCLITHNSTNGDLFSGGGGIGVISCSPRIENNVICFNTATGGHGGAILVFGNSYPEISNNIIFANQATGGGAFACYQCNPVLINNTIVNNSAEHGGGIDCIMTSPRLINSILFGNQSGIGSQVHCASPSQPSFYYCDIEGGKTGFARDHASGGSFNGIWDSVINADPLFADIVHNDFHLADTSPCISSGIDSVLISKTWYCMPQTDFEGNPRPNPAGSLPDMGALENNHGESPMTGLPETDDSDATEVQLFQNYPNPCSFYTTITYSLPACQLVTLKVYDTHGRNIAELANEVKQTGEYTVILDATELHSGIYFYQIIQGDFVQTQKCVVIK